MIDQDHRLVAVPNKMTSEAELASQRIAPLQPLVNDTNSTAVIQPDLVNSNHPTNFFVGNIHISPVNSNHPTNFFVGDIHISPKNSLQQPSIAVRSRTELSLNPLASTRQ
jgi:hypothetical protein